MKKSTIATFLSASVSVDPKKAKLKNIKGSNDLALPLEVDQI